jgi:superfamily II DNA or RNA helicase
MNNSQTENIAEFIASQFANASSELAGAVKVVESNDGFCVALTKRVGDEAFNSYRESARRLGMRFDPGLRAWCISKEAAKARMGNTVGKFWRSFFYIPKRVAERNIHDLRNELCYTIETWRRDPETGRAEKTELTICHMKEEEDSIRIPRGLALKAAKVLGINIPDFAPDLKEPGEEYMKGLRDYQKEVFRSAAAQLKKIGAAVIQMATGAGKSFLAGAMARWLNDQGYKVFLVALSKDLVLQLKDYAERAGAKDVVAVTVQTLVRRLGGDSRAEDLEEEDKEIYEAYADEYSSVPEDELIKAFKGEKVAVIMDEAHHVPASTVRKVMMEAGDGRALRIGLTATPWRNDDRDLDIYAYSGTVVEPRITSSFLIENGYAVPVTIKVLKAPECTEALELSDMLRASRRREGAKAFAAIRKAVLECGLRNQFIAELAAGAEKPVLIITPLIKHAELLGKMLKELGLKAEVVTGAVKAEKRKEIFDALRRGEIEAIVATTLADEGLDLPPLRSLIIAFGGRSKTRVLQRIGRLVRPYSGKTHAVAYELEDEGVEYVMDHLEMRKELYKSEPAWRVEEEQDEDVGGWGPMEVGGWAPTEDAPTEAGRHAARSGPRRRRSKR